MPSGLVMGAAAVGVGILGYLFLRGKKKDTSATSVAARAAGCASGTKAGKADAAAGAAELLRNDDDPTLTKTAAASGDKAAWMDGFWSCYATAYKDTSKPKPKDGPPPPPPSKSPAMVTEAQARSQWGSGCSAGFLDGWHDSYRGGANEGRLAGLYAGLYATKGHAFASAYQQSYRNGWAAQKIDGSLGDSSAEPDGSTRGEGVSACSSGFDTWWAKYGSKPTVAGPPFMRNAQTFRVGASAAERPASHPIPTAPPPASRPDLRPPWMRRPVATGGGV